VWVGEAVVDGLVEFLDQFLAIPPMIKQPPPENAKVITSGDLVHQPARAALGMVPYFTHQGVADRLKRMHTCVVIDKPPSNRTTPSKAVQLLRDEGLAFPTQAISGFEEDLGPIDEKGQPMVVGPYGPWPARPPLVGPIRVWGYGTNAGVQKPLPHAKLLVVGKVAWFKDRSEWSQGDYQKFIPEAAWFGSANWTERSTSHLELGAFTTDLQFVEACLKLVTRVILESETHDSTHRKKLPQFREAEFEEVLVVLVIQTPCLQATIFPLDAAEGAMADRRSRKPCGGDDGEVGIFGLATHVATCAP
jgi:hypothetical protein